MSEWMSYDNEYWNINDGSGRVIVKLPSKGFKVQVIVIGGGRKIYGPFPSLEAAQTAYLMVPTAKELRAAGRGQSDSTSKNVQGESK